MVVKAYFEHTELNIEHMSAAEWLDLNKACDRWQRTNRKLDIVTCIQCGGPVHPVTYTDTGLKLFSHNPGAAAACPIASKGESAAHTHLKMAIYRAANRTKNWTADVEVPTDVVDIDTGRPAVVDVVATPNLATDKPWAFEVQLSPLDVGSLLTRHEIRERALSRCTWVSRDHPAWAEQVPWYQIEPRTPDHPDLVVAGVSHRTSTAYVPAGPFPADQMVSMLLRRVALWAQGEGWILNGPPIGNRPRQRQSVKAKASEWCGRATADLPAHIARWEDADWEHYAHVAHDKLDRHQHLDPLDEAALARYPVRAALTTPRIVLRPIATHNPVTATAPLIEHPITGVDLCSECHGPIRTLHAFAGRCINCADRSDIDWSRRTTEVHQ